MRRAKGFTLIEMLAVLVILVTLAAIVIPRFINAGTRSREAALRQTLAGTQRYLHLSQRHRLLSPTVERFSCDNRTRSGL